MSKEDAYQFLKKLEEFLNEKIPPPKIMRREVDLIVKSAKESQKERHKAFPEGALLNQYIAPNLYDFISNWPGMDKDKAQRALLSESHRQMSSISSGPPGRHEPHPFNKVIGVTPKQVMKQWKGEAAGLPQCSFFVICKMNSIKPGRAS